MLKNFDIEASAKSLVDYLLCDTINLLSDDISQDNAYKMSLERAVSFLECIGDGDILQALIRHCSNGWVCISE